MLTAAVRDLHAAAPGRFHTDVRTSVPALWENNPHLTPLRDGEPGVERLDMHYPLIHQSNQRPYHFLHGYPQYMEERLGLRIPVTDFRGDIHLTAQEKGSLPPGVEDGIPQPFWILVAGGKHDFTAKWWDPKAYQQVVDHFQGRLTFVQCGEAGHWHPRLRNVVDRVGRTTTRAFVRLLYHAAGVLCPVTYAMGCVLRFSQRQQRGEDPVHAVETAAQGSLRQQLLSGLALRSATTLSGFFPL
jgi:hypothetical protein